MTTVSHTVDEKWKPKASKSNFLWNVTGILCFQSVGTCKKKILTKGDVY